MYSLREILSNPLNMVMKKQIIYKCECAWELWPLPHPQSHAIPQRGFNMTVGLKQVDMVITFMFCARL